MAEGGRRWTVAIANSASSGALDGRCHRARGTGGEETGSARDHTGPCARLDDIFRVTGVWGGEESLTGVGETGHDGGPHAASLRGRQW